MLSSEQIRYKIDYKGIWMRHSATMRMETSIALLISLISAVSGADKYGVVIDAGGSHTTLYLYKSPADFKVDTIHTCTTKDEAGNDDELGIDQFKDDPNSAAGYLKSCLEEIELVLVEKEVPIEEVAIFLGATSGLRNLQEENPQQADDLMMVIRTELDSHRFKAFPDMRDSEIRADILAGNREGAYSWATVNVALESFDDLKASMDLGGSSAQMVIECRNEDDDNGDLLACEDFTGGDVVEITDDPERTISVYSHSAQCYGLEEAMRRFVVQMAYEQYKKVGFLVSLIPVPCLYVDVAPPSEYFWLPEFPTKKEDIMSVCTEDIVDESFKEELNQVLSAVDLSFFPEGGDRCETMVAELFDKFKCDQLFGSNCFNFTKSVSPATKQSEFYALSEYWWDFFLPYGFEDRDKMSLSEAISGMNHLCQSGGTHQTLCWKLTFFMNILNVGYGAVIDEQNFDQIHFAKDINGIDAQWPLGFMAQQSLRKIFWIFLSKIKLLSQINIILNKITNLK